MAIKEFSASIASDSAQNLGIAEVIIAALVETLLPIVLKCWINSMIPSTATADALQEHLNDHFDVPSQTFDQSILNQMRPQARRAARQRGEVRLGRDKLDAISTATLMKARTTDTPTIAAALIEASNS